MILSDLLEHLHGVKRNGAGYTARCPAHDDRKSSLSVAEKNGRILLKCFAGCETVQVVEALGLSLKDLFTTPPAKHGGLGEIVATYDYTDGSGTLLYQVVRFIPKDFRQRRPDPNIEGEWLWNLAGVQRVLYNLPAVIDAHNNNKAVFVVEGEKDVESLRQINLTATTSAGGASKWSPRFSETLSAGPVVIIPDNDIPGEDHATLLRSQMPNAAILHLPDLPPKGDVTDWLNAGGTRDQLIELARQALAAPREPVVIPDNPPRMPQEATDDPEATLAAYFRLDHLKARDLTELATANRLAHHYGEDIRHSTGLGWLVWDGQRWARSEKAAQRRAHDMGRAVRDELQASRCQDPEIAKAYFSHAKAIEKATGVKAILELARALLGIDADQATWDAHPTLFNVTNGTLDLATGELRPADRADNLTKLCPVEYTPDAECPRWIQFLWEIFENDPQLIDYVQWALGYAMTGITIYDCFFVLWGGGANGKTTLIKTVQHVMGLDYSQQIDPEELMQQHQARHSTELASLRGARFVASIESGEGRRLNEPVVKALTGGDRIRARFMRQDSFEFTPDLKLFIGTNHKPAIRDNSSGMWRRVRLLPFTRSFDGSPDKDPNLADKLVLEAPGILAWLVQGAQRAIQGEPTIPDAVRAATETYMHDEDLLGQFIAENCEVGQSFLSVPKSEFYKAYRDFCGGKCEAPQALTRRMREREFVEKKVRHQTKGSVPSWVGIFLNSQELQQELH